MSDGELIACLQRLDSAEMTHHASRGALSTSRLVAAGVCQVLEFVRVALNARKVNLLAVDRRFSVTDDELTVMLPVDAELNEFTVSVSGQAPRIRVVDPEGRSLDFSNVLDPLTARPENIQK